MKMNNKQLRTLLNDWGACQEARTWLGDRDADQMWADCERADWMLWYAGHVVDRPSLVLAACACARTVLHLVPTGELRPLHAIEMAERWANGDPAVTLQMVRQASASASYASASYAASHASYAASHASSAASASYAASHAASASSAFHASHAASAASAASAYSSHSTMCALIRERWPVCPLPTQDTGGD
jgi:hypothetical protein